MMTSWGNFPKAKAASTLHLNWCDESLPFSQADKNFLVYGQGRSYGDCCLNENGILISTKNLNRLISFDKENGVLECEAGITLNEILDFIVPHDWFLPVLPGTKFVSLGGAIANDVHGKNHHRCGTFGKHVLSFMLLRSNGEKLFCSPESNKNLFEATIGGIGLTGIILSAKIKLKALSSPFLNVEYVKFNNLEEFFSLARDSENHYEYTVAWLDCIAQKKHFGRGIFMRANHCHPERQRRIFSNRSIYQERSFAGAQDDSSLAMARKKFFLTIPFHFPSLILNRMSVKVFNNIYFYRQTKKTISTTHFDSFFFPLDSVKNWNRIYGKKGFVQYQCVLPEKNMIEINKVLKKIVAAGAGSFLSVLKTFGHSASPGLLSFPMPGVTLALDFPYRGEKTNQLLNDLDNIVMQNNGRVYLAKDAMMSPQAFKQYYPNQDQFVKYIDPKFSSSLWRRVNV